MAHQGSTVRHPYRREEGSHRWRRAKKRKDRQNDRDPFEDRCPHTYQNGPA
jgi:hypothetical protein